MSVIQVAIISMVVILGVVIFVLIFKLKNKTKELPFDEQLRRLESLRKENLISESEYSEKRKKMM